MSWHVQVRMSHSSLLHVTHLLILLAPMYTHNTYCAWAISPSQGIQSLYTGKTNVTDSHTFYSTLQQHSLRGTCTKLAFIPKSNYLIARITGHVYLYMALTCVIELWLWLCMTFITTWTLLIFRIFTYIYICTDGWNARPEQWQGQLKSNTH